MKMTKLDLIPIPSKQWEVEFNKVLKDPYIKGKYNRQTRLTDKIEYIDKYLTEIKMNKGFIIDLGPGPGEFLEVCRAYGNDILGIDAKLGDSEMGDNYLKLSQLMVERQNIPVQYIGFENILKETSLPFDDGSVSVVNSQGSIEMIFKDYMIGTPLKNHKNSMLLSWNIDDATPLFKHMMNEVFRILKPGGIFLIFGNSAKNVSEYDKMICNLIQEVGFKLEVKLYDRLHKMRK